MTASQDILQTIFGYESFRAPQGEIIQTVIDGGAASGSPPAGLPAGGSIPLASAAAGASGAYPADPHMGAGTFQFATGTDGYIAFVLDDPSGPLYGWMRVDLHDDGTAGSIKDWAFSDQPILVGQIPEPSAWLLVAASLTALFRRRRR